MKFKHGDRVTCNISGVKIKDARISMDMCGDMYLCQNDFLTFDDKADDSLGYSFSFPITSVDSEEYDIKLKEKTLDDLEVGDILVTSGPCFHEGRERKVLTICGGVYFLSGVDTFTNYGGGYTIEEIKSMYTLRPKERPKERPEDEPEEITMAQLEKELGRKVKIIK